MRSHVLCSKQNDSCPQNRITELAKAVPASPRKRDSEAMSTTPDKISRQSSSQSTARQYRIVPRTEDISAKQPIRSAAPCVHHYRRLQLLTCSLGSRPKVWSAKELAAAKSLRMFDAVPTSEAVVEVDTEMEKFQNLLQDYLTGIDSRFGQINFVRSLFSQ